MTAHSRLIINNDPQNISHLSREDKLKINDLQLQIEELKQQQSTRKVPTAFELFENKHFNSFKSKFEHLSNEDIKELLVSKWENEIEEAEREDFNGQAKAVAAKANQELQLNKSMINQLLKEIHDIKFPFQTDKAQALVSSQIKASGKIKFMSAYRFFRKEMVPLIKQQEPLLDSKGRHTVVQNLWHQLHDRHKLAYVLMSRADREKSLYIIRLNQIKEELRHNYPEEYKQLDEQLKSKISSRESKNRDAMYHGMSALESINEKINEECLSQEEDDEQQSDDNSDNLNSSKTEEGSKSKASAKGKQSSGFNKQEFLNKINETRQREVDRVTKKFMGAWNTNANTNTTPDKPSASHDTQQSSGTAQHELSKNGIASCLINHQQPPSVDPDLNGSPSIFSKEFTSKNYEFAPWSFEETKLPAQ